MPVKGVARRPDLPLLGGVLDRHALSFHVQRTESRGAPVEGAHPGHRTTGVYFDAFGLPRLALDGRLHQARRRAGAGGSGASAAPGAPGWRPGTGGRSRGYSTYSTSLPSGEVPEKTDARLLLQLGAVGVVHLVAVTVPLLDVLLAVVHLAHDGALGQLRRVHAEPHGAAHVALAGDDVQLLGHGGDDRVGGGRVELGGVGVRDAGQVARGLDHDALQAQAEAEQRDLVLAGVLDRADLAEHTAVAEAAGDADRRRRRRAAPRRRPGSCSRRT